MESSSSISYTGLYTSVSAWIGCHGLPPISHGLQKTRGHRGKRMKFVFSHFFTAVFEKLGVLHAPGVSHRGHRFLLPQCKYNLYNQKCVAKPSVQPARRCNVDPSRQQRNNCLPPSERRQTNPSADQRLSYTVDSRELWTYLSETHQIYIRCSVIIAAVNAPISIPMLLQCYLKIGLYRRTFFDTTYRRLISLRCDVRLISPYWVHTIDLCIGIVAVSLSGYNSHDVCLLTTNCDGSLAVDGRWTPMIAPFLSLSLSLFPNRRAGSTHRPVD